MTDHSDLIAELRDLSDDPDLRSPQRDVIDRAADALSSQSLSLSEAREEIERLRGLVSASEAHRYRACGELLARVEAAEQALKPFADFAQWVDADGWTCNIHREGISVRFGPSDFRRARSALENGPAVLADATNDPSDPDLSSLRKGAEVEKHRLESGMTCEFDGDCYMLTWPDGHWLTAKWDGAIIAGRSPFSAWHQPARKTAIAALVSGSREDG